MNIYFDGWVSAGAESTVYTFLIIFVNISTPSVAGLAQGISTFFPLFFWFFAQEGGLVHALSSSTPSTFQMYR
jgi:hypothetical protein